MTKPARNETELAHRGIHPQIVLTFDDGPHDYYSNAILDALEESRAPAVFFVLGSKAKGNVSVLQRMARSGCEIGVHGWTHQNWSNLTQADVVQELSRTIEVIEGAVGCDVKFYRPPYGILPAYIAQRCEELGLTPIGWHVSSFDWSGLSTNEMIVEIALAPLRDRILLLHDGYGNPAATAELVRWLLPVCEAAGIRPTILKTYLARCLRDGQQYKFGVPSNTPLSLP